MAAPEGLPTIAHKLFYGMTLTSEEKAIAEEFGVVKNTVEKGLLPLPISPPFSTQRGALS